MPFEWHIDVIEAMPLKPGVYMWNYDDISKPQKELFQYCIDDYFHQYFTLTSDGFYDLEYILKMLNDAVKRINDKQTQTQTEKNLKEQYVDFLERLLKTKSQYLDLIQRTLNDDIGLRIPNYDINLTNIILSYYQCPILLFFTLYMY